MNYLVSYKRFKVEVHALNKFTESRQAKVLKAIQLLEEVLNSQEFEDRFMGLKFMYNQGMGNAEIYSKLMSGQDKFSGRDPLCPDDYDIDLDLTMYFKRWNKVIGYTFPNTVRTWINGWQMDRMSAGDVAGNILHEYMHKMSFPDGAKRLSVPYLTGDLCRDLCDVLESGGKLTPKE